MSSSDSNNNNSAVVQPKNTETKWNGWGYSDTQFLLNDKGEVELSGNRYLYSGKTFPHFRKWAEENCGLDIRHTTPAQDSFLVPTPIVNKAFVSAAEKYSEGGVSLEPQDRIRNSHGHTLQEIYALRYGSLTRIPDGVVYPRCHDDVERIIAAASTHNVCVIPFGGGTSVSQAVLCPENEKRMIISMDMKKMNRILFIDRDNMTIKVEAGMVGKALESQLKEKGLRLGHEPDSYEFSTVGGWVATRASGMKKNVYGNIEDMLVWVRMVTPTGVVEKGCNVPRISSGPDVFQMVLGSEGLLGVVTEVVLRVRTVPPLQEYGSIVFPDLQSGVACLREINLKRCTPSSIRLVDNQQFQIGQALKPAGQSYWSSFMDSFKKFYVTTIKGFSVSDMCAATLCFEGTPDEVAIQKQAVFEIASRYHGLDGGEANGIRGYFLTYCIAYIRDYGLNYDFIAESFETSVSWTNCLSLIDSVKKTVRDSCQKKGVILPPFVSCRVTQTYDTGVCVYFYYGFVTRGLSNPVKVFSEVEDEARETILQCGGSVSHHHGVGKLRKRFMESTLSAPAIQMLHGLKRSVDPKNIMGCQNLIDVATPKL